MKKDCTAIRIFDLEEKAMYCLQYCVNELAGDANTKLQSAVSIVVFYASAVVADCLKPIEKYMDTDQYIKPFLIDSSKAESISIGISNIFSEFHSEIVSFLGNNPWVMHEVEVKDNKLIISKLIDFRIMAWNRLKEEFTTAEKDKEAALQKGEEEEIIELERYKEERTRKWLLL